MELLVLTVYCMTSVLAAPPPTTKTSATIMDKPPTGHCDPVCTCQTNGHYYSVGERWKSPEDPCTVYQCFQNGIVDAVSHGCSYKGECKAIESVWKDGCNTYICTEEGFIHYKLVEAGCSADLGECMAVGERKLHGCDILECQIDGGCLTVKKVFSGCAVEGGCKPVNSFWHDGCTVYTCVQEGDNTVERPLGNEMMHWPEANFAMLKPEAGCPLDIPEKWVEGYRKHFSEGQNSFSSPLSLAGEYMPDYVTHQFCTHHHTPKVPLSPEYQTYWEPGSYCILRSGGNCPRGFSDGFILFDDNDKKAKLAEASGTLPDGEYTTDTGLFFCCRSDGHVLEEIVLPKEKSFVMFLIQGEMDCQKVRGMTHSVEFISFDGSPSSVFVQNGSLPETKFDNGDVTLYLCQYKPMGCGCADIDGQFVAVGTERTIDCVTKKCISEHGFNILKVVSTGCSIHGRCESLNAEWFLERGESCTKQICKLVVENNVESYEVVNVGEGCTDGDYCRDLGYERYQGCYTSVCALDPSVQQPVFKVRKADCPWLNSCKPVNSTWTHGCMTYRCDMDIQGGHYQWKIQPIEYGCNDGDKCYKVGDIIQGRCYQAECKLNKNKTVVYLDVIRGGCTWKDECKKVNETWKDGCHQFQCVWTNTDTGFTAVVNATSVSCEWNNTCYADNEVWTDGCVDYKCVVRRQEAEVKWGVETVRLGCRDFNGKCLAVGENITEGCITYKCNHHGDRIGLDAVATGCKWKKSCRPENSTWRDEQKCVDYKCLKTYHKHGSVMQIKIVDYGKYTQKNCKAVNTDYESCVYNNTCKPVNATWTDGCRSRKCVVRKIGKLIQRDTAPISAGCDDEGVCRPDGYKKLTASCMVYECKFNDEFKDSFFTLSGRVCRSRDGRCFDSGKLWDEKEAGICVTYKCAKDTDGYRSTIVEQSCRDVNGVCKPIGSAGFSAEVRGQLRANCTCTQAQNKVIGVNISCAK